MSESLFRAKYNAAKIKLREKMNPIFASIRRKKLKALDFSIISNNCWGGHVYRYYGLPYNSPTIGLYFFAPDYITFLMDLKSFLKADLKIIDASESRYYEELIRRGETTVPIGRIEVGEKAVEIVFLHYHSTEEAIEKWNRRKQRVNFDNLVVKNSYQNFCTEQEIIEFQKLDYTRKVFFVPKPMEEYGATAYFRGWEKYGEVLNDTTDFRRYVDLTTFING